MLADLPAAKKQRNRTSTSKLACNHCRASHLKCDGSFPCLRCIQLKRDCEYTQTKKRGRRVKPVEIETSGASIMVKRHRLIFPAIASRTLQHSSRGINQHQPAPLSILLRSNIPSKTNLNLDDLLSLPNNQSKEPDLLFNSQDLHLDFPIEFPTPISLHSELDLDCAQWNDSFDEWLLNSVKQSLI
jgi:hypothetical protein